MEIKKEIVRNYVSQGLRVEDALEIIGVAKSSYYYKSTTGKKGIQKTTRTECNGKLIDDKVLVKYISKILSKEFIDYGYRKVTALLKRQGYVIGKKKAYRLMKEYNLLNPKPTKTKQFDKIIITEKPQPLRPLEVIEMDIKYIYIEGIGKNAYLISLLDVFHREVYQWGLFENMKTDKIIQLILTFIDQKLITKNIKTEDLTLAFRTDNGSQFTSENYRNLVDTFGIKKTYIPPATPQLNGHIESYHSTVQKLVCDKYSFNTIEEAETIFTRFFETYNNTRILSCLLNYAPKQFILLWNKGKIGIEKTNNNLIFFFKEEDNEKSSDPFKSNTS